MQKAAILTNLYKAFHGIVNFTLQFRENENMFTMLKVLGLVLR